MKLASADTSFIHSQIITYTSATQTEPPEVCFCSFFNQVTHSQEVQAESQTHTVKTVAPTEIKDLQAELQDTLRTLQQQEDPVHIQDDDKVLGFAF